MDAALHHYTGEDASRLRVMESWMVRRMRSCADKLDGGWERDEAQQTAKRYDDDGYGKTCWVETASACCCYYGGESAPPTNKQTSNDKEKRHGATILASLPRAIIRSSIVYFQPINH